MKANLSHLPDSGASLRFVVRPETFPVLQQMIQDQECKVNSPVEIELFLEPIRGTYRAKGKFAFMAELVCSRCLAEYQTRLKGSFSLLYSNQPYQEVRPSPDREIEFKAEDADMISFQGEEIDFVEGVQEHVVMAFPIQPLCGESCKGLCPQCGANRNLEACNCHTKPADSRFAVLKGLKLD